MAINVTIGESKTQEKPFPKLMTLAELGGVFYFATPKKCVCIVPPNSALDEGEFCLTPALDLFIDINSPITLQNQ